MKKTDMGLYILDAHQPVKIADPLEWARWLEDHNAERIVKQEVIGGYLISTIFLGIDHNLASIFFGASTAAPPILFETMVFHRMGHEKRLV